MDKFGVLCTRIRVEEKQLTAALAEVGAPVQLIQPAALPMPPANPVPLPPAPALTGGLASDVLIDRLQNRAVGAATITSLRLYGADVLCAGIAATGSRLEVATALARAGVARPTCWFAPNDETALAAVEDAGYPATLLPLAFDSEPVILLDRDTAEAVTEHRAVLGSGIERVGLVQAGDNARSVLVIVVDGVAVAARSSNDVSLNRDALRLAEAAAVAIHADAVGIELVESPSGWVVWDVDPVPDFRHATPLNGQSAAQAIASLACRRVASRQRVAHPVGALTGWGLDREEVSGDVVLTA